MSDRAPRAFFQHTENAVWGLSKEGESHVTVYPQSLRNTRILFTGIFKKDFSVLIFLPAHVCNNFTPHGEWAPEEAVLLSSGFEVSLLSLRVTSSLGDDRFPHFCAQRLTRALATFSTHSMHSPILSLPFVMWDHAVHVGGQFL